MENSFSKYILFESMGTEGNN